MDREFVIHFYKKFWSRIEDVVDANGDFYKIIVYEICIYTFSEIFSNASTLTIYFIVLNVSVEFVLIYRPHPVIVSTKSRMFNNISIGKVFDKQS